MGALRCLMKDVNGDQMIVDLNEVRLVRRRLSTETAKANAILVFKDGSTYGTLDSVSDIYKFMQWAAKQ